MTKGVDLIVSPDELPVYATADMLPAILDRPSTHVLRILNMLPRTHVRRTGINPQDMSQLHQVTVFNVKGAVKCDKTHTTDLPQRKPPKESLLEKEERRQRLWIVVDHLADRHRFFLRVHQTTVDGSAFAEIGVSVPTWPGLPPTLYAALVYFHDDATMRSFLDASGRDPGLLDAAVDSLAARISSAREKVLSAISTAASDWKEDLELELAGLDTQSRQRFVDVVKANLPPAVIVATSARKAEQCGLAVQRALAGIRTAATDSARQVEALKRFEERTGYDRYPSLFPLARRLDRKIVFLAGPTNSGKTHEAMRLAIEADTAEVLSPLRLLALEHRDLLLEGGKTAGLITGEEHLAEPHCTHIARTIETVDLRREVKVAVIDEIQMLADPNRGWAWTQALVGVPASQVVLTGSPDAIPLVERLAAALGEPLEVRRFERKTPLLVADEPVKTKDLRRGDALIAFSRREVHQHRETVARAGLSVACIYGNLGPEVRRSEARRFREGEADILIATDAIGMGLNLPIQRIVFTSTEKFDGSSIRRLSRSEILQIAGRAGRFGQFEQGEVAVRDDRYFRDNYYRIWDAVRSGFPPLTGKAYVRPNIASIEAGAELLGTDRIGVILRHLEKALVRNHPDLQMAELDEDIEKADRLDNIKLSIADRYSYVASPISLRASSTLDLLAGWARSHHDHGTVAGFVHKPSQDLEWMEHGAHISTVWLWLARRFPDVYREHAMVRANLSALNTAIEERLARTAAG